MTPPPFTIHHDTMLRQLYAFCAINSGTRNLDGLALMHAELSHAFKPMADVIKSIKLPQIPFINMDGESVLQASGDALFIQKRPHLKRRVLLCGHMDTVYGVDNPFQHVTLRDQKTLNGPGVADMKGGLVVMLHALQAFECTPIAQQLGWDVVINTDEENGSLASSTELLNIARRCQAALVYEPAMTETGTLAKNRKGNGKITLIATGIAAHAGRDFNSGRNAICFLAEIITAIDALNHQREGVTLNIGLVSGGTTLNTVPDKATAKIDVRLSSPLDESWVLAELQRIQQEHTREGASLKIDAHFDRPVKQVNPATERLFSRLVQLGKKQGLSLSWADSGGCCDGNNLAQNGLPVIDTLGVRGGLIHTPDEFIHLDSLVERAQLSAQLLMDLAEGALEDINRDVNP